MKLNLTEMVIFLENAGKASSFRSLQVKKRIEDFPISRENKKFLYVDLPIYLRSLTFDTRNLTEHPSGSGVMELMSKSRVVRRKALGIGEESYLVRLLTIKKACRG